MRASQEEPFTATTDGEGILFGGLLGSAHVDETTPMFLACREEPFTATTDTRAYQHRKVRNLFLLVTTTKHTTKIESQPRMTR